MNGVFHHLVFGQVTIEIFNFTNRFILVSYAQLLIMEEYCWCQIRMVVIAFTQLLILLWEQTATVELDDTLK